jgi:hypothetical protein
MTKKALNTLISTRCFALMPSFGIWNLEFGTQNYYFPNN